MPANQSNLATTFTAPPVGQLVDQAGLASQRFLIWLNALFKRFLILRANLVQVSSNYQMQLNDCTIQCVLTQPNPIVLTLPDPSQIQGQIYIIKNDATSVSTASLAATGNVLVDNAAPSAIVLSPGQAIILESDGTNWIKLGLFANSVNSSAPVSHPSTNGSSDNTPSVPLDPSGVPISGTPVPPGVPTVTTLPGTSDPLSVVNQLVLLNGVPYRFTLGLDGGTGYWALDVTGSPSIRDTWANLSLYPAANYAVGTIFVASDRSVSYAVQIPTPSLVKTWIYYNGIYQAPLASIPTDLDPTSRGFVFRASDYKHNWIWDAGWTLTTGGFHPGTFYDYSSPGLVPVGDALWQACDGSTVPVSQDDATLADYTTPIFSERYLVR